jgi:2-polyprenyl-6-methoxyphenol hydroxylase-like FAD-dependent oxidoreductase
MKRKVLVVGGGIAGMSAAICLRNAGVAVDLVELDAHWRALGAGVTINSAALRAFASVGVLERIKQEGRCGGVMTLRKVDGEVFFTAPAQSPFGPDIPTSGGILRPVLHRILSEETLRSGAIVKLAVTAASLRQTASCVEVGFSDATTATYDLVLGADGLHSKVREMIFPDAPQPRFSGQGCWRALVPRPFEVQGPRMYFGRQKVGVNPVSQNQMYLFLLHNVPDNRRMPPEQWPDLLKAELAEYTDPVISTVREELNETSSILYRPLEALLAPNPWYRGRILLIGDAAHATTPHNAYGAGLAVEDGIVLAELINSDVPAEQVLQRFMERRFERCRLVVEMSVRLGDLEQRGAPLEEHMQTMASVGQLIVRPI